MTPDEILPPGTDITTNRTRCARDRIIDALRAVSFGAVGDACVFEGDYEATADIVLTALGIDRANTLDPIYELRRTDRDLDGEFDDEYGPGHIVDAPNDWEWAEADSSGRDAPIEYELITYVITHTSTRSYHDGKHVPEVTA